MSKIMDLKGMRLLLGLVLALTLTAGFAACDDEEPVDDVATVDDEPLEDEPLEDDPLEEDDPDVSGTDDTETFFDDAAGMVGEEVTVTANVLDVIGDNAFRIGSEDEVSSEEYLVIYAADDPNTTIDENDGVIVTGMVVELDREEAESKYNIDLSGVEWDSFEGEYGIHADSVTRQ